MRCKIYKKGAIKLKLISIIVPVYNAEKTIKKCIDSILAQTYRNFELILINDGSRDSSLNILKEYENTDERIVVISQENSGVSVARNKGIDSAKGDYIIFVDSDDYIRENALEVLKGEIEKNSKLDMVISGFCMIKNNEEKFYSNLLENKNFNNLDFLLNEKLFNFISTPWGKIYKAKIIKDNNIRFNEALSLGEDTIFVLEYLKYIQEIKFIKENLFFINETQGSLSRRNRLDIFENIMIIYDKAKDVLKYRKEYDFNKIVPFYIRNIKICINTAVAFKWKEKEYKELCNKIRNMEDFKNISLKNVYLNKYDKIIFTLLKNKHIYLLKIFLKFKNMVRRNHRQIFESIKN